MSQTELNADTFNAKVTIKIIIIIIIWQLINDKSTF